MSDIRLLIMDVDGTLTDGKIYIGGNGEAFKAFNVKDGYGIANLRKYDIEPVLITSRNSTIVSKRATELKIQEVYQGVSDKLRCLSDILQKYHYTFGQAAYIGDDVNDMKCIGICGFSACPADAVTEVKEVVDYVCKNTGGNGAVREVIDLIISQNGTKSY